MSRSRLGSIQETDIVILADSLKGNTKDNYIKICVRLYKAALKGDWATAKGIIDRNPSAVCASITRQSETALHIAAAAGHTHFVEKLVRLMSPKDLALQNKNGYTALCYAASAGRVRIAKVMVDKNPSLPKIVGDRVTPLSMAASFGHHDMVQFLYNHTKDENSNDDDYWICIFNTCISTGLFDVALDLFNDRPGLAMARDKKGETALHAMAQNPSAFTRGNNMSIWTRITNSRYHENLKHHQAPELLRRVWDRVLQLDEPEVSDLIRSPERVLFVAAELGNTNFLVELIRSYPDLIWKTDDQSRTIFHIAVIHRHADIFNLIYEIGSIKDILTSYKDEKNSNMLHLAAEVAPAGQLKTVYGPALQMQRELLWFKEVEKIMQPSFTVKKNSEGWRPHDLFSEKHKSLMKEGEKWMKDTATSCMIVAALIATVVFAAAFTVPGGNDQTKGYPLQLKEAAFMVFAISDAIALFASCTSILMFLAILTSRYSENDFIKALPTMLMIGLTALFVSITAMMVAFTATFFVLYHHDMTWLPIPVAVLACLPAVSFAILKYPFLRDVISSTYNSKYLFRPNKRLLC